MRCRHLTRFRLTRRLTPPSPVPRPAAATMASKDGSTFFFTSESVNEGHPDKLADQVRGARRSIVETHSFVRSHTAGRLAERAARGCSFDPLSLFLSLFQRGWDDSLSSSSSSSSPPSASSSSHIDTHLPSPTNTPSTHPSIMIRSPMASSTRASRRTPTPRWLARRRRKPAW